MLNSGAIRAPIDERYKNGNSSSTIAERSTREIPASGYHGTVCVLIYRLHNNGGHPHSPSLWSHCRLGPDKRVNGEKGVRTRSPQIWQHVWGVSASLRFVLLLIFHPAKIFPLGLGLHAYIIYLDRTWLTYDTCATY